MEPHGVVSHTGMFKHVIKGQFTCVHGEKKKVKKKIKKDLIDRDTAGIAIRMGR